MNFKAVFHLISFLLMILGAAMGVVAGVSYLMGDTAPVWQGMLWSGTFGSLTGAGIWAVTRTSFELTRREGIGIVVFGWFGAVITGSLPFLLCGTMSSPVNAIFESCSGLTTTGASVMTDLENHSRAILLWRACLHFLGGMGILVLVVAIIPFLGVGGMQIFRAEVTGPSKDRLTPRIASTAKLLWGVYIFMNISLMILLKLGGMDWFDSVCHAFATISTGGFSTRTNSIAAYNSLYIESVVILFMLLSGMNFALHFRALRGDITSYMKDSECRFYLGIWGVAVLLVAVNLTLHGNYSPDQSIRHSVFYVTSIMTCTGLGTVDYDTWPVFSKSVLVILFVIGGCAGSTSGGIKQMRLIVLLKKMTRDIRSFLKPQVIFSVKIGKQIVAPEIVFNICVFFFIYISTLAIGTITMSWYTVDQSTAFSSVLTCLAGAGPGFSTVGPMVNFDHLHNHAKLILCLAMLLGRLEFYTLLVVIMPTFWRK